MVFPSPVRVENDMSCHGDNIVFRTVTLNKIASGAGATDEKLAGAIATGTNCPRVADLSNFGGLLEFDIES